LERKGEQGYKRERWALFDILMPSFLARDPMVLEGFEGFD